jgi:hypothetical protein
MNNLQSLITYRRGDCLLSTSLTGSVNVCVDDEVSTKNIYNHKKYMIIIIVRSGGPVVCSIGSCDCEGGGGGGRCGRRLERSVSDSIVGCDAIRDTSIEDILVIRKLLVSNLSDIAFRLYYSMSENII